jgi:hypothetical protein
LAPEVDNKKAKAAACASSAARLDISISAAGRENMSLTERTVELAVSNSLLLLPYDGEWVPRNARGHDGSRCLRISVVLVSLVVRLKGFGERTSGFQVSMLDVSAAYREFECAIYLPGE